MERANVVAHMKRAPVCAAIACAMAVCYLVSLVPPDPVEQHRDGPYKRPYPRTVGLVSTGFNRKWDLLTFVLCQPRFVLVVPTIAMVLVFGPAVEQAMTKAGFLRYIFCVAILTGISSMVVLGLMYLFVRHGALSDTVHCGSWVMLEMIMVSFSAESLSPNAPLAPSMIASVRPQQWPLLVWLASVVVSVLNGFLRVRLGNGYFETIPCLACGLGMWLSWAYMRYVCCHSAPSFAFHMLFFPAPVRNAVKWIGAVAHRYGGRGLEEDAAELADVATSVFVRGDTTGGEAGVERVLLPGSTPEEADRRRAVALAALATRIHEQREQTSVDRFPPRPSQRSGAAPAPAHVQEPDDDHKENADV